jgi:FKBP-type peptidyl-prolyl cis-trans isomerase FkpA
MHRVLIFLPAVLWAQTQTPNTPPPQPTQSKPAAAASTAPKPAAAKTASPSVVKRPAPAPKPMTDEEKIIYALGLSMYRSLGQFDLSAAELDLLKKALTDAAAGKPAEDIQTWGPRIQELAGSRAARAAEKQKALSGAFLSKAAGEAGAQKTQSGMVYRELRPGAGESPKATDTVKVNYRGTLVDGTEFDSSYKRGEPAQFSLNGVIKCWTEGVQKMKVGGKSQLVCPADLAYGDGGRPGIPGGATLVFEIELLQIGDGPGK